MIADTAGKSACAQHVTADFWSGEGKAVDVYFDNDGRAGTAA